MIRIKELRKEKELTQKELAEKLRITDKAICAYETSIAYPKIETLLDMADLFGCSVDYILGREGEDGVVVVSGNELSPDEEHLVSILRQLPPDKKDTVYTVAELAYDVLKAEEKKKR